MATENNKSIMATGKNKQIASAKNPRNDSSEQPSSKPSLQESLCEEEPLGKHKQSALLIPKLRFKEFEEEWENEKFGKLVNRSKAKYNPTKDKINLPCIELECLSQETGELLKTFNSLEQKSIKNKFEKGEVLFGKLRPYLKKYLKAPFKGVCSSEIWVLKGTKLNNEYLYQLIQTHKYNLEINITSGSKMPRAEWNYISNVKFKYPPLPEQQKIANFLTAVDTKIQQLSTKKELLQQYKKGVMQQLFSQKMRFKQDDGTEFPDWEEKKLGEVCIVMTGNKDTQDRVNDGLFPFYVRSNTVEKINSYSFDGEAILTSGDGVGVGKNFHYVNGKFDYHQRVYALHSFKEGFCGKFIYQLFKEKFYKRVMRLNAKNSVDSVRRSMITEMKIDFPNFAEQQKIANYLSVIDTKIETITSQINNTKTFKKGLLQQLFV